MYAFFPMADVFYVHLLNIISDAVDSTVGRRVKRCKTTVSIVREPGAARVSINGERLYFIYF